MIQGRGSRSWYKVVGQDRGTRSWTKVVGQGRGTRSRVKVVEQGRGSRSWVKGQGCTRLAGDVIPGRGDIVTLYLYNLIKLECMFYILNTS